MTEYRDISIYRAPMIRLAVAAALAAGLSTAPTLAGDRYAISGDEQKSEGSDPLLSEEDMEELSETARQAIENFTGLIAPMLNSMGALLQDLPQYEAPEVLPNGDIIIRRYRGPEDAPTGDEEIET